MKQFGEQLYSLMVKIIPRCDQNTTIIYNRMNNYCNVSEWNRTNCGLHSGEHECHTLIMKWNAVRTWQLSAGMICSDHSDASNFPLCLQSAVPHYCVDVISGVHLGDVLTLRLLPGMLAKEAGFEQGLEKAWKVILRTIKYTLISNSNPLWLIFRGVAQSHSLSVLVNNFLWQKLVICSHNRKIDSISAAKMKTSRSPSPSGKHTVRKHTALSTKKR